MPIVDRGADRVMGGVERKPGGTGRGTEVVIVVKRFG